MLDALPHDFEDHERAIARIGRALEGYEVGDDFIDQGWQWLTRDGLVRASLDSDFGDPRPVVYAVWDEANDLSDGRAAERMRSFSTDLFRDNPYRPHLVVVLERPLDEKEADLLPFAIRRAQLVGFDTASVVWDLTPDLTEERRSVAALRSIAQRLGIAARAANVEAVALVRDASESAISAGRAMAKAMSGDVLVVANGEASPARLAELQRTDPACVIVAAQSEAAAAWLRQSAAPDEAALAVQAILAANECRLGDTFTIRGDDVRAGCPLGCGRELSDLGRLRASIAGLPASGELGNAAQPIRARRRRCI